jgi:hypothetical protein
MPLLASPEAILKLGHYLNCRSVYFRFPFCLWLLPTHPTSLCRTIELGRFAYLEITMRRAF